MSAEGELSKSARKRANRKARESGEAEEEAAPPPPAPKAKATAKEKAAPKAKAAAEPAQPESKAKSKAKAKAEPKGTAPAPAPPAPKAEAKAKAKGEAKAKAQAPAPEKEAPKAAPAKASSKAGAKAKAKSAPEPEPEKEDRGGPLVYYEIDDGSRKDEWEVSSGQSKKAQRRKEVLDERKEMEKAQKTGAVIQARQNQIIPGLAPPEVQMAQAKGKAQAKAKANQSVMAIASVSAAAAADKGKEPEKAAESSNNVSETIKVPEKMIGRVVGPKGSNVNLIKEKTGVKTVDMSGDMCTIVGSPEAVGLASHAIKQLIEKGYMSLAFEDFEEEGVPLHPSLFPDIIGKGGVMIQEIKKQAKVEVDIPPVPKNSPPGKKYKVTLAGSKAGVALGKQILTSIEMYGHHELTHPGVSHTEMEIEPWQYAFIIGSKGSEMRHIQNNYKVRVNIPREFSANQQVVIIGEPRDIERAIKYIEKVLYEGAQPKGRGAPEKATDDWGDDGEVEDWMRPYMYQRK